MFRYKKKNLEASTEEHEFYKIYNEGKYLELIDILNKTSLLRELSVQEIKLLAFCNIQIFELSHFDNIEAANVGINLAEKTLGKV